MKNITRILFVILTVMSVHEICGQTGKGNVPQQRKELITVMGDSLTGSVVNGESIREVMGHVVLTQGNIRITCNHATQFLVRNNAILEGNVVVTQDTLVIRAEKGYYYGNEKIAECKTGVTLNDGKVILSAINGNYYFNENRAYFADNVRLYDTVSTMTCNQLNYLKNENKAVATGRVVIFDSLNTIHADSMVHFRDTKTTFAEGNVSISNVLNNVIIYGNHLEDYSLRKYTMINREPILIQIDTTGGEKSDTLMISARQMESFNDSSKKFIAKDSVRIWRGDFSSKNNYSVYFRDKERILTYKQPGEQASPVLWYDENQLSGDSVTIYLKKNQLKMIQVNNNGFILSQNKNFLERYDQISGEQINIYFDTLGINHTDVSGNVLSIYYTYDSDKPNGLTKSSSQRAKIIFKNKKASDVRLFSSPVSEYYPENLVEKNELSFTLPSFRIIGNRPDKNSLLKGRILR